MDIQKEVPDVTDDLSKPIQSCLCNSVAYANITCDPVFCTKNLLDGVKWAVKTDNPMAATGGVSKKVFKLYAIKRDEERTQKQADFFKSLDDFLEPD